MDDTIVGGDGDDVQGGGEGNDTLYADGNDVLYGGEGDDTVLVEVDAIDYDLMVNGEGEESAALESVVDGAGVDALLDDLGLSAHRNWRGNQPRSIGA